MTYHTKKLCRLVGLFFMLWGGSSHAKQVEGSTQKHNQINSLKKAYAGLLKIGVAVPGMPGHHFKPLSDSEKKLIIENFDTVTPENAMKPIYLQKLADLAVKDSNDQNKEDYQAADYIVGLAKSNGLTVNGHTLIWYSGCPEWLLSNDRETAKKLALANIKLVVEHFRGDVVSWDVVNEAIAIDSKDENDFLRKKRESKQADMQKGKADCSPNITKELIRDAFVVAHEADPNAMLYYNDFDIIYGGKRRNLFKLINYLQNNHAPLHGIGIQAHWRLKSPTIEEIEHTICAIHNKNLKVAISELDIDIIKELDGNRKGQDVDNKINTRLKNGLPEEIKKQVEDRYQQLFELFSDHADKIDHVTFWGLHDGLSWMNTEYAKFPKGMNYPLPWDSSGQPKYQLLKKLIEVAERKKGLPHKACPPK